MFGIGATEFAIILLFAFLIFGPDKLPAIAKTVGRAISKFRDAQNEMNEVIKTEVYDPAKDKENPFQKPLDTLSKLDEAPQGKTESFAERKAKYDRERAERKAAEAAATGNAPAENDDAAKEGSARPVLSAEELYGVAPKAKPAPKSAASAVPEPASQPAPEAKPVDETPDHANGGE